jgi:serine protease Do
MKRYPSYLLVAPYLRAAMAAALCSACLVFFHLPAWSEESPKTKQAITPATDFSPIVARVVPSVVTIFTSKAGKADGDETPGAEASLFHPSFFDQPHTQRMQGLGSGVIISADGLILTSNHVIDGAEEILVGLASEKQERKATKVGADPGTDLAILKIEGKNLPVLPFADSDKLRPGQIVLAIGSPFGLTQTVTMGIVSAVGRGGLGIIDYANFIQTDAAINMGNSGGALVDTEGRLVGINSAILSRTGTNQGIGFAVPSNLAREVMPSLREKGRVIRGYIGATLQTLTPDLATVLKLKDQSGVVVSEVAPKSPAEAAGIRGGDVITTLNGRKMDDPRALRMAIGTTAPGTKVKLELMREGERKDMEVVLIEMPPPALEASTDAEHEHSPATAKAFEGRMIVADVDDGVRQAINAPKDLKGAVIVAVDPGCPVGKAGLRQGDVIRELNKHPVSTARELVDLTEELAANQKILLQVWSEGKSGYVAVGAPNSAP